jgi:CHAT domain-containing protein
MRIAPFILCGVLCVTNVRAAEVATPSGTNPAAEQLISTGKQAFDHGSFPEAAQAWHIAAESFARAGETARQIDALLLLSAAYQSMGQSTQSIETLDIALPLSDTLAHKTGDRKRLVEVQNALGSACTFTESAARAEALLNDALEGANAGKDDAEAARIQNNLGTLFSAQRAKQVDEEAPDLTNYNKALAAFDQAATLARQTGQHELACRAMVNKAVAANHNRQYDDTLDFDTDALQVINGLPDSREKATLLLTAGRADQAALAGGATALTKDAVVGRVYAAYQSALAIATALGDDLTASDALGYTGELYESQGRFTEALILTRKALFLAQQKQSQDALYRWQWQSGRLLADLHDNDSAIASYLRAQDTLKDIRNDISLQYGNPNMRSSFSEQAGPAYMGLADLLLLRAAGEAGTPAADRDMRCARDTSELLKSAELEDYFQDKCAQLYRQQQQDIDAIAREHRAAIIYIIPLANRTELLVTLPGGLQRFSSPVTATQLAKTARAFRASAEQRTTNEFAPLSRQLYQWLIAPLEGELQRQAIQTLVFVPDGALRAVPMAALADANGKFLIEKYPIAITPGLSLMPPRAMDRRNAMILRCGLSVSKQGFPELKFVPEELSRIGGLYGGQDLLNTSFTGPNINHALKQTPYTIVHIASHGEFRSDSKETFLLTFDDRINLHDLEMLIEPCKFAGRPVELLMLSACQTASGDDRAALGLAGVAVKAGARSAVATLWSVNDEASSQLVMQFYSELHDQPDISKAEALRRAQIKLISGKTYAHPAYWSPFLLIGNWL